MPNCCSTMAHELGHTASTCTIRDWEGEAFRRRRHDRELQPGGLGPWTLSDAQQGAHPQRLRARGLARSEQYRLRAGHATSSPPSRRVTLRSLPHGGADNSTPGIPPCRSTPRRARSRRAIVRSFRAAGPAAGEAPARNAETRATSPAEPVVLTVGLHNSGTSEPVRLPAPRSEVSIPECRRCKARARTEFEAFQPVLLMPMREARKPQNPAARRVDPFGGAHLFRRGRLGVHRGRDVRGAGRLRQHRRWMERCKRIAPASGRPETTIVITAPTTSSATTRHGTDSRASGRALSVLGGGDHLKGATARLKQVVQEAPDLAADCRGPACAWHSGPQSNDGSSHGSTIAAACRRSQAPPRRHPELGTSCRRSPS